jgi:hypothetical protein
MTTHVPARLWAGLTLAAALAAVAACGPATSSTSGSAPASPAQSAPAAATWDAGGTYTGSVPPADPLPGPRVTWQLNPYTNPDGYRVKDSIKFGVPLHFAVPQELFDCNSSASYQFDLPPGQIVVPFEITIKNLINQQGRAIYPSMSVTSSEGNFQVTGMSGSALPWRDGTCTTETSHLLSAGSSDALYGFIGPATAAQLAGAKVSLWWDFDANAPGIGSQPLTHLLPHQGASYLAAHS